MARPNGDDMDDSNSFYYGQMDSSLGVRSEGYSEAYYYGNDHGQFDEIQTTFSIYGDGPWQPSF